MGKKKTVQKQQTPAQQQNVDKSSSKADKKSKKTAQKQQPAPKEQKHAGKTKIIKKQQKPSKVVPEEKQQKPVQKIDKKSKPARKQVENVQVFTPEFYTRVSTFQTFFKQVLELKSSANGQDVSGELTTVNDRVRESLQAASAKILKQELVDLEEWIQGEQKRLREEIQTIEKSLQDVQKSLEATKFFSVDEIQNQIKPIKERISQKQATLASYGNLLSRSQGIYQDAPQQASQEEEKKEAEKVNESNKDNEDEEEEEQDLDLDLP